jgi:hypothetical protein
MALAKYYEDIIELRGENRASIEFEYQHPQANIRRAVSTVSPTERRRADVPSSKIIVWLTIIDASPVARRIRFVTSRAVRTVRPRV